jgi:hypothetical protein
MLHFFIAWQFLPFVVITTTGTCHLKMNEILERKYDIEINELSIVG